MPVFICAIGGEFKARLSGKHAAPVGAYEGFTSNGALVLCDRSGAVKGVQQKSRLPEMCEQTTSAWNERARQQRRPYGSLSCRRTGEVRIYTSVRVSPEAIGSAYPAGRLSKNGLARRSVHPNRGRQTWFRRRLCRSLRVPLSLQ
jgi:hypothetical protein